MFECLDLKEEMLFRVRNMDLLRLILIEKTNEYEIWELVDCTYMPPENEILKDYVIRACIGEKYKVRNSSVLKKNILTILIQFYVEQMNLMEEDFSNIHKMIKEENLDIKDIDYDNYNDYIWALHIDLGFERFDNKTKGEER